MVAVAQAQRLEPRELPRGPGLKRVLLIMAAILAGVGLYLALPRVELDVAQMVDVRQVRLTGEIRYTQPGDVEAAVSQTLGGGFFTADLEPIGAAVRALPWVANASVRRVWPNGLTIHVVEHQLLARWGEHGGLSDEGVVFYPRPEELPEGLTTLHGPEGRQALVRQRFDEIAMRLAAYDMEIANLELSERRTWSMRLTNGVEFALGRDPVLPRVEKLLRVWPELKRQNGERIVAVDLRYTNGLALRLHDGQVTGLENAVPKSGKPRRAQ